MAGLFTLSPSRSLAAIQRLSRRTFSRLSLATVRPAFPSPARASLPEPLWARNVNSTKNVNQFSIFSGQPSKTAMNLSLFVSLTERINRKRYWFGCAVLSVALFVSAVLVGFLLSAGMSILGIDAQGPKFHSAMSDVATALMLGSVYPFLALSIKRLHDRDTGRGHVQVLLPVIGPLWLFIEIGFLRGVSGRHGADPLAASRFGMEWKKERRLMFPLVACSLFARDLAPKRLKSFPWPYAAQHHSRLPLSTLKRILPDARHSLFRAARALVMVASCGHVAV
jgi:uncharacterized membrane protein YhaH (DUF805 family)